MQPENTTTPIPPRVKDITGDRYGILVVVGYHGKEFHTKVPNHLWLCYCDCGGEVIARAANLKSGNTKSCGCLHSRGRAIERRTDGVMSMDALANVDECLSRFGERLYAVRRRQRMSLQEVGDAAGTSKTYIWQLEKEGMHNPTVKMVMRLAIALKVSPSELLGFDFINSTLTGQEMQIALAARNIYKNGEQSDG